MYMPNSYPLDRTEYGKHNIIINFNPMCMAQPTTIEERQVRRDLNRVFRLFRARMETLKSLAERRTMIDVLMADYRSFEPPKI